MKAAYFQINTADIRIIEEKDWNELPLELRERAVDHLVSVLPSGLRTRIQEAHAEFGPDWIRNINEAFAPFHFCEGMSIRNALRDVINDNELPSGNWDDYYVSAVERACGCKEGY